MHREGAAVRKVGSKTSAPNWSKRASAMTLLNGKLGPKKEATAKAKV